MQLTMFVSQGLFIVGQRIEANQVKLPRIFTTVADGTPENGMRIQLAPFPGLPGKIRVPENAVRYGIPDRPDNKAVYDLYKQVTAKGTDINNV